MGVEDKRGRPAVEDGCLAGSAGHSGSRSWRVEVGTAPGKLGTALEQEDGRVRGLPGSWACHIIIGEKLGQSLALSASV